MRQHEEEPQELPDEVQAEVNRIMEGSVDDRLFTINLLGSDAFSLLRYLYRQVSASSEVKKFAEKWEQEHLGADAVPRFIDPDNPESVEFDIYQQLINQISLGKTGVPGTVPRTNLPDLVSLNVTPRAIDTLNGGFLKRISDTSILLTEMQTPLSKRVFVSALTDNIGIFLKLNAEVIEAGIAPRPSYSKFIKGLQKY